MSKFDRKKAFYGFMDTVKDSKGVELLALALVILKRLNTEMARSKRNYRFEIQIKNRETRKHV